ncbi:hypothetical protein CEXT_464801 [Caerostris extrusa]|uniref:RNase H type-1 domain-containing protein n=1 Tax=Caerostris extrusa TaxID=172846 RepID=A0AAV4S9H3_CAEEX|nr:hypothetical protein CEXT_464801 [Caerostris extrusa]
MKDLLTSLNKCISLAIHKHELPPVATKNAPTKNLGKQRQYPAKKRKLENVAATLYHLRYLRQDIEIDHHLFKFEKLEERLNFEPPWNKSKFEWRYMKQRKEGCYMYTDGSKMNGREQYHETRRLSEEASVFMAELKAIETAIEYVTSNHFFLMPKLSDSDQGACWSCLKRAADSYAKQATLKEDIDFHLNSTFKSIKKAAHNAIKIAWQQQWTTSVKGKSSPYVMPKSE